MSSNASLHEGNKSQLKICGNAAWIMQRKELRQSPRAECCTLASGARLRTHFKSEYAKKVLGQGFENDYVPIPTGGDHRF